MPLSETKLKNKVIQFIKKEYPFAWIYKTADRWTAGIPDILLCIKGLFYAIELKVAGNKPTKLQEYVLNKIRSACGRAGVCRSVDEVKKLLKGEVIRMIKIGDKVLVIARVIQITEDDQGVHYVVAPDDKKRNYQNMKVEKEDLKACLS